MNHVALDRPGPHDRDLDHQVVEARRFHPGQHRHLRAAFDLEDTQRIGLLDHREHVRVVVLQVGHANADALGRLEQAEGPVHAAQHAQAEHIDLHELQGIDIVLVPFDHLPVGHRRGLDRNEVVEPVVGEHEAAWMLRQVPGRADQLACQVEREAKPAVIEVEVQLGRLLLADAVGRPAPDQTGQGLGHVLGQAQHLADFAYRAACAVTRDDRRERGMLATIAFVDPLDDLLAPLMLEVDVDIGRLLAFPRDEALEQKLMLDRVDAGDAQHEADAAVRCRPAPLAKDAATPRLGDDRVHGQEIGRITLGFDQSQFMLELASMGVGHARREHPVGRFAGQSCQRRLGAQALDHILMGILIAELGEVEATALGDIQGRGERVWKSREAPAHLLRALQCPVAISLAAKAQRIDRALLTNGGDDILQQPRLACVIKHVASRDGTDAGRPRHIGQCMEPYQFVGPSLECQGQMRPVAERSCQGAKVPAQAVVDLLG